MSDPYAPEVEKYALDLVVKGATSFIEDDIDEEGDLTGDSQHQEARALAYALRDVIRHRGEQLLTAAYLELKG